VSPLSCFELSLAVARGRIALDRELAVWVRQALAMEGVAIVDLKPAAAVTAATLGAEFPKDPVDRMLYATAAELGVPLVTKDRRLREADPERTVW